MRNGDNYLLSYCYGRDWTVMVHRHWLTVTMTDARILFEQVRFKNGETHSYTTVQLRDKFGVAAHQVEGGMRVEHKKHGLGVVEVRARLYACTHTRTRTHARTHACMNLRIHAHSYAYILCMHTHPDSYRQG